MHRLSLGLLALFVFSIPWGNVAGLVADVLWAASFASVLATCILERRVRRPPALFYIALALLIWQLATYYWSTDPDSTLARVRLMLLALVVVWMVVETARDEHERTLLAQSFVLGCYVLSIILFQAYLSGQTIEHYRYVPSYLNPNDSADLLAAGIAAALLIISSRPRRRVFWLNLFFVPMAFVGVFITASRSGFIISCLAAVGIFFLLHGVKISLRFAWVILILGALSAGFFSLGMSDALTENLERITFQTDTHSLDTLTGRTTIWSAGMNQFYEHPLVGVGAGAFPQSVSPELGLQRAAHNVFVESAVEMGIIGLALFATVITVVGWRVARYRDHQRGLRIILLLVLVGTCLVANVGVRYSLWFILALLARTGEEVGRLVDAKSEVETRNPRFMGCEQVKG